MQNSLWLALGGRLGHMGGFNEYAVSPIDEVLQRESFELEDLLEEDQLLQEVKFCNGHLLEYLSRRGVVEQLVRYTIARPPTVDATDGSTSAAPENVAESILATYISQELQEHAAIYADDGMAVSDAERPDLESVLAHWINTMKKPIAYDDRRRVLKQLATDRICPFTQEDFDYEMAALHLKPLEDTAAAADSTLTTTPPAVVDPASVDFALEASTPSTGSPVVPLSRPSAALPASISEEDVPPAVRSNEEEDAPPALRGDDEDAPPALRDEEENEEDAERDRFDEIRNTERPTAPARSGTTPDPSGPHVYKFAERFPYIASEILCSEVPSIIDLLVEDDELLTELFSILNRPPPLDPSTVSYFRKVLQVLIQRRYAELVSFCSRKNILDSLLKHLGLYSGMELCIMLGWDSGWQQQNDGMMEQQQGHWMQAQGLIPKLVRRLHPHYAIYADVHAHAGRLLVDVVVKCPLEADSALVAHLQTTPVLQALFSHMFAPDTTTPPADSASSSSSSLSSAPCPSSLSNALSVIIVLVQRFANRHHNVLMESPGRDDEDAQGKEVTEEQKHDFQLARARELDQRPGGESSSADADEEKDSYAGPPSATPDVVRLGEPFLSLLLHLPRILDLLLPSSVDSPASSSSSSAPSAPLSVPGVLGSAPFGSLRMKVVELCLVLARSGSVIVDQRLAELGVAQRLCAVWFAYPWNNLLHGLVESIVSSALEEPDAALTKAFWTDGLLVETLVAGYERNEEQVRSKKMRFGYMGHLIRAASTLEQQLRLMSLDMRDAFLGAAHSRWQAFLDQSIGPELQRQQHDDELEGMMMNTSLDGMGGLTSSSTQQDLLNPHPQEDHQQLHQIFPDEDDQESDESSDEEEMILLE
jgi:hypothetical protein